MRKSIFLAMLVSISMIGAAQNPVEVDGVYYNLTKADSNENPKNTASIVPRPDGLEYSGSIILPNAIRYEGVEYKVNPRVTPATSTSYLNGPFENSTIKELTIGLGEDTEFWDRSGISLSLKNCHNLEKITFSYMRQAENEYAIDIISNFINLGNTNGCVELFVRQMEDHCELVVKKFNVYGPDGKQLKPRLMYDYTGEFITPDSNNTFILDTDWEENGVHVQILNMVYGSYLITQLYGVDDEGHFQNIRCETPIGQTGTYTEYNGLSYGIDSKATVISPTPGKDYAGDIVIPETIKYNGSTIPVSCIGMDAFTNTSVTSIKIEPAYISLNRNSFSNAAHLRLLDMSAIKQPTDQPTIKFEEICSNCPELTEVLLPACPATFRYSFINNESLSTIRLFEGSELYEAFTGTNTYSIEIVPIPESAGNPESKVAFRVHNNGLLSWNGEPLPLILYINKVVNNNNITIMPDIYGDIMVFNRDSFYNVRNDVTIFSGRVHIMCSNAYVNGDIGVVSFKEEQLAGVDSPQVEASDAPACYFNLQGMEVDAEHLAPGIYIRRTANSASKVLVR